MAQTDAQTSDAQRAIARAVAVASAQLRKEFRLRSEKQRRDVSELQQAVAQLKAQIAAMSVKTERTVGTQMPPPLPLPLPPPPPPRSSVETPAARFLRREAEFKAANREKRRAEAARLAEGHR